MMLWQGLSIKNYFDGWAKGYDADLAGFGYAVPQKLAQAISGQDVLDLGIGTGLCAQAYMAIHPKARIYGVDVSERMLQICKAKGVAVDLREQDLEATPLPYENEMFDSVMCGGVSEFMKAPDLMIRQAARTLKAGGVFAIAFEGAEGQAMYKYTQRRAHYIRVVRFGLWPRISFYRKYLHDVGAMVQMCQDAGLSVQSQEFFIAYERRVRGKKANKAKAQKVGHWILVCKKPANS